jgi:hypothetical protein
MDSRYDVHPDLTTPKGVRVDTSGHMVDSAAVDCLIDRIEKCLYEQFGKGDRLVYPDIEYCPAIIDFPANRKCMVIKIAGDSTTSPCTGQQVLTWQAPNSACEAKGQSPDKECLCRWRAGVQDGNVLVVTPNWYLFPDWFIRLHYGCLNPWSDKRLAKCAKPLTSVNDLALTNAVCLEK